ncbi:TetR/AcrR family transcriptional regulator [Marinobacter lipolyticus]|uniref:TetR/AcrR family transcriptional regulator n=1 Tax=Marinobacter lipolyticus TaxID=209639 RepID=UPI003A905849
MSKKDDLIAATKELLWQVGYESMSPKQVLAESGAGQGSLYHHFEGKEALALIALEEVEAELRLRAERILLGDGSPMERIDRFLTLERAATRGCRIGRLVPEVGVIESSLHAPIKRYFQFLGNMIEGVLLQAKASGEIPEDAHTKQITYLIVAAVQGGYILARAYQDDAAMSTALDGVRSLLAALQQAGPHSAPVEI